MFPRGVARTGSEALWNAAELAEKRKDAAVAREFLLMLPHELNDSARSDLAMRFAQHLVERYGVCAECSIHQPSRTGDERNHHAHILTTMRTFLPDGKFGERVNVLSNAKTGSTEVADLRESWEQMVNSALELAGRVERVSALPLAQQRTLLKQTARDTFSAEARQEIGVQLVALDRLPEPKFRMRRSVRRRPHDIQPQPEPQHNRLEMPIFRARRLRHELLAAATEAGHARADFRRARYVEMVLRPDFVTQLAARLRRIIQRLKIAGQKIDDKRIESALVRINAWLLRRTGYRLNAATIGRLEAECLHERDRPRAGAQTRQIAPALAEHMTATSPRVEIAEVHLRRGSVRER